MKQLFLFAAILLIVTPSCKKSKNFTQCYVCKDTITSLTNVFIYDTTYTVCEATNADMQAYDDKYQNWLFNQGIFTGTGTMKFKCDSLK